MSLSVIAKMRSMLALLAVAVPAALAMPHNPKMAFDAWKKAYGRTYATPEYVRADLRGGGVGRGCGGESDRKGGVGGGEIDQSRPARLPIFSLHPTIRNHFPSFRFLFYQSQRNCSEAKEVQ